jgi:hypothetical protein
LEEAVSGLYGPLGEVMGLTTVELWDGSLFTGQWIRHDGHGVLFRRAAPQHDLAFVPWHSIKVMNGGVS